MKRMSMQETPEAPAPLGAPLGTPDSAGAAAAAMEFATSVAVDSLALSGAVLSTGKGASSGKNTAPASQQPPEAAAAQLEAWREVCHAVLFVPALAWQVLFAASACDRAVRFINAEALLCIGLIDTMRCSQHTTADHVQADKYLVDNPLADKAAAAAAMERPAVPATLALLASSGSLASVNQEASDCPAFSVCPPDLWMCALDGAGEDLQQNSVHRSCREPLPFLMIQALPVIVQVASPAAALGLFDLEEFSFGAPPASYRDSTPGLLMDQSLGAPATLLDVEVCSLSFSSDPKT